MTGYKMSPSLQKFVHWLESDLPGFVAIVEEGSQVSGDPWQQGFSDHDLPIAVEWDVYDAEKRIYDFLLENPLGDEYLTGVRTYDNYKSTGIVLDDLTLKFRSKTIGGHDVVTEKPDPDRDAAAEVGAAELAKLPIRFERCWINLAHWSGELARHRNYERFKEFFVYFSALHYGRTGHYPVSRTEAASLLPDQAAAEQLLSVTHGITTADKQQQKAAIEAAIKLIHEITAYPTNI